MATIIESTIGSGADYENVYTWVEDKRGDFVTADQIQKGILIDNREYEFTSSIYLSGSTTDADHYWWLTVSESVRHNGIPDTGAVLKATGSFNGTHIFFIYDDCKIDGIDLNCDSAYSNKRAFATEDVGFEYIEINGCIIRNTLGAAMGMYIRGSSFAVVSASIFNNILINTPSQGIYSLVNTAGSNINIYNNTVYSSASIMTYGIRNAGTATYVSCKNNIAGGNNTADFLGMGSADRSNNISSDSTAAGSNSHINQNMNDVFIDTGSENFHILQDSIARNNGVNLSQFFNNDIDNEIRGTWDIGADDLGIPIQEVISVKNSVLADFSLEFLEKLSAGWKLQGSPYFSSSEHNVIFYRYNKPYEAF